MAEQQPLADYRNACERAAVFDASARGRIVVSGPEAAFFLHNLCTNDIKDMPVEAGCELFLTTAKGRVVAHGWVGHYYDERDVLWLDTGAREGELFALTWGDMDWQGGAVRIVRSLEEY